MTRSGTLGLIPARAGSRGIPRKNVRPLGGVPLIARTIRAAFDTPLDEVVVSTDGREIAEVALQAGARVPFVRPPELATDEATTLDVVRHALSWFRENEGREFEVVVLLQPTSPLRTAEHIREALDLYRRHKDRSVVSITPTDSPPQWTYSLSPDGTLVPVVPGDWMRRRQELPETFRLNGAIYIFPPQQVEKNGLWDHRSVAYVMPPEVSVDIDTELDWQIAETLLKMSSPAR